MGRLWADCGLLLPGLKGGEVALAYYPDIEAQSYKSIVEFDQELHSSRSRSSCLPGPGAAAHQVQDGQGKISAGIRLELRCPDYAVTGQCAAKDHDFAKEIICNREWCRFCGSNNGKAHQRRKAGWLPRAMQMREMGYFVIPIPPELRTKFRDPKVLSVFGKAMKRVMKYHGFARGLRRWHWFGEDHPGEGLQGDGLPPYHPHLNMLVEAGWLSSSKLEAIRRSVAKVLKVDLARVVVNYSYTKPGQVSRMLHMVKYVLRPTFEHWEWDQEMAYKLLGFRNSLSWGTWKDEPVWTVPAGDAEVLKVGPLERGCCPVDGSLITWGKLISARLLREPWWSDVGGGYWSFNS